MNYEITIIDVLCFFMIAIPMICGLILLKHLTSVDPQEVCRKIEEAEGGFWYWDPFNNKYREIGTLRFKDGIQPSEYKNDKRKPATVKATVKATIL